MTCVRSARQTGLGCGSSAIRCRHRCQSLLVQSVPDSLFRSASGPRDRNSYEFFGWSYAPQASKFFGWFMPHTVPRRTRHLHTPQQRQRLSTAKTADATTEVFHVRSFMRWVASALALDWLSSRANNVKGGRRNITSTRAVEPGAPAGG